MILYTVLTDVLKGVTFPTERGRRWASELDLLDVWDMESHATQSLLHTVMAKGEERITQEADAEGFWDILQFMFKISDLISNR